MVTVNFKSFQEALGTKTPEELEQLYRIWNPEDSGYIDGGDTSDESSGDESSGDESVESSQSNSPDTLQTFENFRRRAFAKAKPKPKPKAKAKAPSSASTAAPSSIPTVQSRFNPAVFMSYQNIRRPERNRSGRGRILDSDIVDPFLNEEEKNHQREEYKRELDQFDASPKTRKRARKEGTEEARDDGLVSKFIDNDRNLKVYPPSPQELAIQILGREADRESEVVDAILGYDLDDAWQFEVFERARNAGRSRTYNGQPPAENAEDGEDAEDAERGDYKPNKKAFGILNRFIEENRRHFKDYGTDGGLNTRNMLFKKRDKKPICVLYRLYVRNLDAKSWWNEASKVFPPGWVKADEAGYTEESKASRMKLEFSENPDYKKSGAFRLNSSYTEWRENLNKRKKEQNEKVPKEHTNEKPLTPVEAYKILMYNGHYRYALEIHLKNLEEDVNANRTKMFLGEQEEIAERLVELKLHFINPGMTEQQQQIDSLIEKSPKAISKLKLYIDSMQTRVHHIHVEMNKFEAAYSELEELDEDSEKYQVAVTQMEEWVTRHFRKYILETLKDTGSAHRALWQYLRQALVNLEVFGEQHPVDQSRAGATSAFITEEDYVNSMHGCGIFLKLSDNKHLIKFLQEESESSEQRAGQAPADTPTEQVPQDLATHAEPLRQQAFQPSQPSRPQEQQSLPQSREQLAVPAQAVPAQVVPAQAVPVQAVPVQAVPAQAVPVQAVPAQAVPAQPQEQESSTRPKRRLMVVQSQAPKKQTTTKNETASQKQINDMLKRFYKPAERNQLLLHSDLLRQALEANTRNDIDKVKKELQKRRNSE